MLFSLPWVTSSFHPFLHVANSSPFRSQFRVILLSKAFQNPSWRWWELLPHRLIWCLMSTSSITALTCYYILPHLDILDSPANSSFTSSQSWWHRRLHSFSISRSVPSSLFLWPYPGSPQCLVQSPSERSFSSSLHTPALSSLSDCLASKGEKPSVVSLCCSL